MRPRSRRSRFVLYLVAVSICPCGLTPSARGDDAVALAKLVQAGGTFEFEEGKTNGPVVKVAFRGSDIKDDDLKVLTTGELLLVGKEDLPRPQSSS